MADEQTKLYEQILREVRESVMSEVEKQGLAKAKIQILAALTRLRQVACDPRLLKLEGEWHDDTSGKLGALREIMQEAVAGGHRVLVFSQFVEMLKLIRARARGRGHQVRVPRRAPRRTAWSASSTSTTTRPCRRS